jgi:hypothetical protein
MAAFVVNPGGAVHSVDDVQVEALLQQGFRLATAEEIAAWHAAQGLEGPDGASIDGGADQPRAAARRRSRRA